MIKSNIKKEFSCDIKKLWNIITDNTKYAWRSDLSKIEIMLRFFRNVTFLITKLITNKEELCLNKKL